MTKNEKDFCIFLTKSELDNWTNFEARVRAMERISTQLTVIGGGPAGVCAAITAARQGIKTALVTDRPMLGGNSSSEIRVWTRGATGGGNLWAEEMGVWGELKLENLYRNPEANPVFWDDVLLDAVWKETNLELFLNTEVCSAAVREDGAVACVYGSQQGSERQLEFASKLFLDATGDGTIGAKAGVPFSVGNEKRQTLGSSILYYTKKEDHPVAFVVPDYAYDLAHIERILGRGGRVIHERMSGSDCWWFEYGGLRDTIKDAQEIALELRRLVLGVWNYVKNSGKFHADCDTLEWIGTLPGKRESRRMQTEYCLREGDILAQRRFPDGAFYGGWYVDAHPSGGMYDSGEENCTQTPVSVYQIPLRCLYSRKVPNLLFAGRDIGVERSVFFSSRVMNTCALSGQAAATLAAQCLRTGKTPGELTNAETAAVCRTLIRDDMFIPGAQLDDPEDLAAQAAVLTSSVHDGRPGEKTGVLSLRTGGFLTFPAVCGNRIRVEVCAARPVTLSARCSTAKLPNRLLKSGDGTERCWELQRGLQVIEAEITAEDCFAFWEFAPAPEVEITVCARSRIGFLCGQTGDPACFEPRAWYAEAPRLYAQKQLLCGESRPWGRPNAWIAAPEDGAPWVELRWARAADVREIRLYLDPDLAMELPSSHARHWEQSHFFAARPGMPPQLVRELAVTAELDTGEKIRIGELCEQHQRLVTFRLPSRKRICRLRAEIRQTWGGRPPVIYRIGVF